MDSITHLGRVESVDYPLVKVRIVQSSACSECHARKVCLSADTREKTVEALAGNHSFAVGETVEVVGQMSMGLKAVLLAYVLPLLVLLAAVAVTVAVWPGREMLAAWLALGLTAAYYMALLGFRDRLKRKFVFEARPVEADAGAGNEGLKDAGIGGLHEAGIGGLDEE